MSDANGWPDDARETLEWALAVHFSQNRQPCMSGDPRDRLSSLQRRNMEDARDAVLEALAPILAHRECAAAAAAWMAAREAGAEACLARMKPDSAHEAPYNAEDLACAAAIRALPPPADAAAALAEVVREATRKAVEREREACADLVFRCLSAGKLCAATPSAMAAAIRARKGGE